MPVINKKLMVDKYRDIKKIFRENWKLFKQNKLGIAGIIIIFTFVMMAVLAPVLTDRHPVRWTAPNEDMFDAEQLWTQDNWLFNSPEMIYGEPSLRETSFYMVGDRGDESHLYLIRPQKDRSPQIQSQYSLTGAATSGPTHYPSIDDAQQHWEERVYVGDGDGLLHRVGYHIGSLRSDWVFDLRAATGTNASIQHSPIVAENMPEGNITIIVATENTIHGINDIRGRDEAPVLLWSQSFEGMTLNQPDIFKNPRTEGLRDTQTIAVTSREGDIALIDGSNGEVLWQFNTEETVLDRSVELKRPVIPLNMKRGERTNQSFYVSGNQGRVYILPNQLTYAAEDLAQENIAFVEEGATLTVPEVLDDGSGMYVVSNRLGLGTIHYLTTAELTVGPEDRVSSWNYLLRGPVSAKPVFYREFVYVATEHGQIYCFHPTLRPEQQLWATEIDGQPISINVIHHRLVQDSLRPVLMIIHHEISGGGVEGWEALGEFLAPLPPGVGPSGTRYILGTDNEGRDIFSNLVYGARIALIIGFAAAFFAVIIGTAIGVAAGYIGGVVDIILMRLSDVFMCMPGLALMIVLIAILGANVMNIVLVIAILGWPGIARVIRSQTLSLKQRPFVDSARVTGASNARIMFRHIAPNVMPLSLLYMTFQVTGAILAEASLSFLGLGDPMVTSWGQMLYNLTRGSGHTFTAWWWFVPPGLSITILVMGFFFIARAFDEIINPRLRERK